jgi:excisionase family DNA binding protein
MAAATASPDDLLTTREACEYLKVSTPTLLAWVRKHRAERVVYGARKTRGGRTVPTLVRYRRRELDRMMEEDSRRLR